MIRSFSAVFLLLLLFQTTFTLSIRTSEKAVGTDSLTTLDQIQDEQPEEKENQKVEKRKEVKLEDEIDKIGKVMHPHSESVVVIEEGHVELKINDAIEMGSQLSNTTVSSTESARPVVGDQSMDGVEALEAAVDGGEQLRHENDELVEMGEHREEKFPDDHVKGERKVQKTVEKTVKNDMKEFIQSEVTSSEIPKVLEENVTENTTELPVVRTTELNEHSEERQEDTEEEEEAVTTTVAPVVTQKNPEEVEEEMKEKKEVMNEDIMIEEPIAKVREEQDDKEKLEVETKKEEDNKLTWELLQFLFMLTPTEEATWWTVVLEAVKCSLRNCPNPRSYWHHGPMYLPRITRHRRQDDEFNPYATSNTSETPQPCPCKNVENYFEVLHDKIKDAKSVKGN